MTLELDFTIIALALSIIGNVIAITNAVKIRKEAKNAPNKKFQEITLQCLKGIIKCMNTSDEIEKLSKVIDDFLINK